MKDLPVVVLLINLTPSNESKGGVGRRKKRAQSG